MFWFLLMDQMLRINLSFPEYTFCLDLSFPVRAHGCTGVETLCQYPEGDGFEARHDALFFRLT
jgi:hypothetical protein